LLDDLDIEIDEVRERADIADVLEKLRWRGSVNAELHNSVSGTPTMPISPRNFDGGNGLVES